MFDLISRRNLIRAELPRQVSNHLHGAKGVSTGAVHTLPVLVSGGC